MPSAYTCHDCGDAFIYSNGPQSSTRPVTCVGCMATYCPSCAHDTAKAFDANDSARRRGVTAQQEATATARRVPGVARRVVVDLPECRQCTLDPILATPNYPELLAYAVTRLQTTLEELHKDYLRVTDVEFALASSFERVDNDAAHHAGQKRGPAEHVQSSSRDDDDDDNDDVNTTVAVSIAGSGVNRRKRRAAPSAV